MNASSSPRLSSLALLLALSTTGAAIASAAPMTKGKPSTPTAAKYDAVTLPSALVSKLPKSPSKLVDALPTPDKWQVDKKGVAGFVAPLDSDVNWAGKKVLVVLQENTGHLSSLPEDTPAEVRAMIEAIVDATAENFEDMKNTLEATGKYDKVVLLTDALATRGQLLANLVKYSKKGATIDLAVLGHGTVDGLLVHGDHWLLGSPTFDPTHPDSIRALKAEAAAMGEDDLNLRLVYLCNCQGSSTSDDWLAIGADVVVAPQGDNYMPEPTTSVFFHRWIGGNKASEAAVAAYELSIPFYGLVFPPVLTTSFTTASVTVPCGETWVSKGCTAKDPLGNSYKYDCWQVKYCTESTQVPSGANLEPHPNVVSSRLVTAGNGNMTFGSLY